MITFFPAPRPAKWPPELTIEKAGRAIEEVTTEQSAASPKKVTEPSTETGRGGIEEIAAKKS
ncbi:MAG TPA: hypothetical protein VN875_04745 [Candidatus Binatus sp.]|jgi:hypothetical protein|nr:hypothetical protein [Candidatus Binatus sp.]